MFTSTAYKPISPNINVLGRHRREHDCKYKLSVRQALVRSRTCFLDPSLIRNGVQRTIVNVGIDLEIVKIDLMLVHPIENQLGCQPQLSSNPLFRQFFREFMNVVIQRCLELDAVTSPGMAEFKSLRVQRLPWKII
jgi:hypothetical protein